MALSTITTALALVIAGGLLATTTISLAAPASGKKIEDETACLRQASKLLKDITFPSDVVEWIKGVPMTAKDVIDHYDNFFEDEHLEKFKGIQRPKGCDQMKSKASDLVEKLPCLFDDTYGLIDAGSSHLSPIFSKDKNLQTLYIGAQGCQVTEMANTKKKVTAAAATKTNFNSTTTAAAYGDDDDDEDDTQLVAIARQSRPRDLGLLTLKALILGPLIGLTIKAALIRGIFYALFAYAAHLFVPGLLGALGLGTGLVGFARQLQPNYAQMILPHLANIPNALPSSFARLSSQYHQILSPVVESIRAIPEGHCRFRAVCETGTQLIRNARSMSSSLQRISATVYMNFGSDYAKAWLDGIVQSDCAQKYSQCPTSPFSLVAAKLAQALGARQSVMVATSGVGAIPAVPITEAPQISRV